VDYFHIPAHGVEALMRRMDETQTCVVAQIHSHPGLAFHPRADDQWAIVRHAGALSLVLPDFALTTTLSNFVSQVAAYHLGTDNRWHQTEPSSALEITE